MKVLDDKSMFIRFKNSETGEVFKPRINSAGACLAEASIFAGATFLGSLIGLGAVHTWNKIAEYVNSKKNV
jgi:hypothetical protein